VSIDDFEGSVGEEADVRGRPGYCNFGEG
jgi:hypothetical protein